MVSLTLGVQSPGQEEVKMEIIKIKATAFASPKSDVTPWPLGPCPSPAAAQKAFYQPLTAIYEERELGGGISGSETREVWKCEAQPEGSFALAGKRS